MGRTLERSLASMERADLLRQVQMHQFSMHDLALYLDTHPTDADALARYLSHKEQLEQASAVFVRRFGALKVDQVNAEDGWTAWSNTPWPWTKEAN